MNEHEFNELSEAVLTRIEAGLERSAADLDFELIDDRVLEIELPDRSKVIVTRNEAVREIWVAARSGGFHYRWDGQVWRDTRSGEELFGALSRLLSSQTGEDVPLTG